MHLGPILVYALHEIYGHYLRRYHSYIMGNKISFLTSEDHEIPIGKEGGVYIEAEFLGLRKTSYLPINLSNLYFIFNFIKDNENEGNNKIIFEDYIWTLETKDSFQLKIIHYLDYEQFIELDNLS